MERSAQLSSPLKVTCVSVIQCRRSVLHCSERSDTFLHLCPKGSQDLNFSLSMVFSILQGAWQLEWQSFTPQKVPWVVEFSKTQRLAWKTLLYSRFMSCAVLARSISSFCRASCFAPPAHFLRLSRFPWSLLLWTVSGDTMPRTPGCSKVACR